MVPGEWMDCSECGTENRTAAKYCAGCGTGLSRSCASCTAELKATAKFCDQCATPVNDAAPKPTEDDAGAIRKTVTVMFADLVGSTAFGEKIDAETARAEMGEYQRLAQAAIERHGGTVAKLIGDGVMAVFGIPDIAEDDAERAVRSGVDLQSEFAGFAERILRVYNAEVDLRVGINTGEIVIADSDDDMFGDALNTAARIESECIPGRVLVGEQTWRLTRSDITYEVLGLVNVKGKDEAIATFQVVEAAVFGVDHDAGTPFVGRGDEIETLTRAIDEAISERSPVLVTVVGSPGVGKTRLAAETRTLAAPHAQSFDLRVDRARTATFEPIGDLLRQAVDHEGGNSEVTIAAIETWIGGDGDVAVLAPLLATFVGASPARSTEESFWASRRLIEILASRRPTVIVVDDIQWAQPLFLDLLDHLTEWVAGPVALICLARPEIREIRPALVEVGRRISEVISLEGLGAAATKELAASLLGADLPPELVARLPESTDGNPLFVRELVRMLVDDGVIYERDGRWVLAIDPDAVEVPPTIQSLLASRVERMPADERLVVEMASIVGSEFARGAVAALLPAAKRAGLDAILERLRRKEIIDPTGTYWGEEPMLRFHHVLIRDASYRRILKQRRAALHQQVAEWVAEAADRFGGSHEITIGFHYEQAHEFRSQLGAMDPDADELGAKAAQLFQIAGERALAQDDLTAAGSLAQRALARLPKDAPGRADLLVVACEAFFSSGNVREADPHFDELRVAALDDVRLTAWADAFAGHRAWLAEPVRLAATEPQLDEAASLLDALDDQAGVAKARLVRAMVLARLGRVGDAEAELDAALTAARAAGDRRHVTAVLGAAPLAALWGPSPVARAGGRCLDIIRLLRITSASPMVEATSVRCQAVLEAMRGRFEQARELIDRSRTTVEELGLRHGILETDMFAGVIELFADDAVAAEPFLRRAYAGLGNLGIGADAGQAAALLSQALVLQGRIDEAAPLAAESQELAGQNLQTAIASRAAGAEIAAEQGRFEEAIALAEAAVEIAGGTDLTIDHARAASTLALVQSRAGNTPSAESATARAVRLYAAKGARPPAGTDATAAASTATRSTVPDNVCARSTRLGNRLLWSSDASFAALSETDVRFEDRRQGIQSTLVGTDQMQEAFITAMHGMPAFDHRIRTIATRGEDIVLVETSLDASDGGGTVHFFQVNQMSARARFQHCWSFDSEAEARNVFDSLEPLRDEAGLRAVWTELQARVLGVEAEAGSDRFELINAATRQILRVRDLINVRDWDGALAQFTDDYDSIDQRQLDHPSVGAIDRIDALRSAAEHGLTVTVEPIAIRGDRLALLSWRMEADNGFVGTTLMVLQTEENGLCGYNAFFDQDDLRPALDELTRLYIEGEGAEFAEPIEVSSGFGRANHDGDRSTVERLVDPDGVFVDHQRLEFEVPLLGMLLETAKEGGFFIIPRRILRISPTAMLVDFRAHSNAGDRYIEQEPGLSLMSFAGGRLTRVEIFYGHDRDAAIRRFEELADVPAVDLTAAEQVARVEAAAEGLAVETIARRGQRCVTSRVGSDEAARYRVIRIDTDGQVDTSVDFAVDDLRGALDQLNELYVDDEGAPYREIIEIAWSFSHAAEHGSEDSRVDAYDARLAEEFVFADHRRLGFGTLDRETTLGVAGGFGTDETQTIVRDYVRVANKAILLHRRELGSAGHDRPMEWESYVLCVGEAGLATRIEMFDEGDLAVAVARFDELNVPTGTLAEQVHSKAIEALVAGDIDRYAAFLHHDYVDTSLRTSTGGASVYGRIEHLEVIGSFVDVGFDHFDTATIAVRGQHLVLSTVRLATVNGDEIELLAVLEVDDAGLERRLAAFDLTQLAEALRLLRQWWLEGDAAPFRAPVESTDRMGAALRRTAGEGMRECLTDSFTFVDRRSLGFGELTIDQYLDSLADIQVQGSWRTIPSRYLQLTDQGLVLELVSTVTGKSGGTLEGPRLVLFVLDGGLVDRMEWFDVDATEDALARFDELTVARWELLWQLGSAQPVTMEIARDRSRVRVGSPAGARDFDYTEFNAAQRHGIELWYETDPDGARARSVLDPVLDLMDALYAHDWERARAALASDFTLNVTKSVTSHEQNANGFIESMRIWMELAGDVTAVTHGFLAASETVCVLDTAPRAVDSAGVETEWRSILLVQARDGLVTRWEEYDVDNVDAALARFDQLTAAPERLDNRASQTAENARAAFFTRNIDTVMAQFASDAIVHDRRPLFDTSYTVAQWRTVAIDLMDKHELAESRTEVVATRGRHVCLLRTTSELSVEGFVQERLTVCEVNDAGQISRYAYFDLDQLNDASAHLDSWFVDSLMPEEETIFEAHLRGMQAQQMGDEAAIRAQLHQDFSATDHRPAGWGRVDVDGWVGLQLGFHRLTTGLRNRLVTVEAITPRALLAEMQIADDRGNEWSFLGLFWYRDAMAYAAEFYETSAFDVALARFDEIVNAAPASQNRALQAMSAFSKALFEDHDLEAALALWHPDGVLEDHTLISAGRRTVDDMRELLRDVLHHEMVAHATTDLRATRLDHLCLADDTIHFTVDGFTEPRVSVVEVDDVGLIRRAAVFEPEAESRAYDTLDQWFAESLSSTAATSFATLRRAMTAQVRGDADTTSSILTADFTAVDHRSAGFGTVDGVGWTELQKGFHEVTDGFRNHLTAVHALSDTVLFVEPTFVDGADNEWQFLAVFSFLGEQVSAAALFDLADFARAQACIDHLTTLRLGRSR